MIDIQDVLGKSTEGQISVTSNHGTLTRFLKTGEYDVCYGPHPVFIYEDLIYMDYYGAVFHVGEKSDRHWLFALPKSLLRKNKLVSQLDDWKACELFDDFIGIIIPSLREGYQWQMIRDGDNPSSLNLPDSVSVSFNCLTRLLKSKIAISNRDWKETVLKLLRRKIQLVDVTRDEIIAADPALLRSYRKYRKLDEDFEEWRCQENLSPPKMGFTLMKINDKIEWHRSSTVVVRDIETATSYILGQDEDTYFGCELSTHPKSVKQALLSLAPPEARNKASIRRDVIRQGEWFAVPCKAPPLHESTMVHYFILPNGDRDSNNHEYWDGEHSARITPEGIFVRGGRLNHDEHTMMRFLDKWYKLLHNTAVRSVSQEGVD